MLLMDMWRFLHFNFYNSSDVLYDTKEKKQNDTSKYMSGPSVIFLFFQLLVQKHWANYDQTRHK